MNALDQYWMEKKEYSCSEPHSPLTRDQAARFEGLAYYPENPAMALQLSVEKAKSNVMVTLQTSTGHVREYERLEFCCMQISHRHRYGRFPGRLS